MIPNFVEIVKGKLGYIVKGQTGKWYGVKPPVRQEGDITTFSRTSRSRLRETLAMAHLKRGGRLFGVTFTIPSPTQADILSPCKVRLIWSDFSQHIFPRTFPHSSLIWRIELQERGQAHWHCVFYCSDDDALSRNVDLSIAFDLVCFEVCSVWRALVYNRVNTENWSDKTHFGFADNGVDVKPLTSSAIVGYVCDHGSKQKQAQLGWVGRQWGVIGRKNLSFEGESVVSVPLEHHKKAARQFRRLQEHLRRDGKYTGVRVTAAANVSRSIFGKDAERLVKCYELPFNS